MTLPDYLCYGIHRGPTEYSVVGKFTKEVPPFELLFVEKFMDLNDHETLEMSMDLDIPLPHAVNTTVWQPLSYSTICFKTDLTNFIKKSDWNQKNAVKGQNDFIITRDAKDNDDHGEIVIINNHFVMAPRRTSIVYELAGHHPRIEVVSNQGLYNGKPYVLNYDSWKEEQFPVEGQFLWGGIFPLAVFPNAREIAV